jgi:hypothetical protein
MFGFKARRQREILTSCEAELERTRRADARFVNSPRDLAERGALLERAFTNDLRDNPTVRQLDFLQRLLTGLATSIPDDDVQGFIDEAVALALADTDGVQRLVVWRLMQELAARGPEPIDTENGHAVYLRCEAEHKRKSGRLVVRDDGLTFTGEVALDIPWSTVKHVANTVENDADAIAIQENKRRTATKFGFWGRDSDYIREVIHRVWQQSKAPLDARF